MEESVWRRRAPVWLRIVTGILFFPALWFALGVSVWALLEFLKATDPAPGWPFLVAGVAAGIATWIIARKSSTPIALALAVLALFVLGWFLYIVWVVAQYYQDVQTPLD
jgi:hypothetical protein